MCRAPKFKLIFTSKNAVIFTSKNAVIFKKKFIKILQINERRDFNKAVGHGKNSKLINVGPSLTIENNANGNFLNFHMKLLKVRKKS